MGIDFFQAISGPSGRAILLLIVLQSMIPNTIEEHFATTRKAVSKHLRILTECKIVKQQQSGREIYYQLNETKMKEIDYWFQEDLGKPIQSIGQHIIKTQKQ